MESSFCNASGVGDLMQTQATRLPPQLKRCAETDDHAAARQRHYFFQE